jgi:succinate-acetate transporter protein
MLDLIFLGLTVLFFTLGVAYVTGCRALTPGDRR